MRHTLKTLAALGFLVLTACQRPMPDRSAWAGTLALPEGTQIPFQMNLSLSGPKATGDFTVGDEKTSIPEIVWNGTSLDLRFSEYGAEMHANWDGTRLTGEYRRIRTSGTKTFPFHAAPEKSLPNEPITLAPTAGSYAVHFSDDKENASSTVAKVWNQGGVTYGTFIAPDGDYGLMKAEPTATGIQLNRFTGWQAFAIEIHQDGNNWVGTFHAASLDKPKPFTLEPYNESPASKETTMKNPKAPFAFACSSLTGETVRNTDERFKGKALIIDIMGTWCHNCMDESPVLQKIYSDSRRNDLEMVGLSFEIKEDESLGRKNLTQYRDRFSLTYPLLYCGSVDDANVDQRIKNQLVNFFAYPTTLFIDRTGKVQTIHVGFHGPGTGADQFQSQTKKLYDLAAKATR